MPASASVQAEYDAEEAELQRAIEESKALMMETQGKPSEADEKLKGKQN